MSDVLRAVKGVRLVVGGRSVRILAGHTTAHADAEIVRDHPDLWAPYPVDFPAPVEGGNGDGDGDGTSTSPVAPAPKDVRAWAKAEGIEVPARGPLPETVVAQYMAAQEA